VNGSRIETNHKELSRLWYIIYLHIPLQINTMSNLYDTANNPMGKLLEDVTAARGIRHDDNIRPLHWQCAHCRCNIPSTTAAQMAYRGCLCDDCFRTQLLPIIHKKVIIPDFQPRFQHLALARLIATMDNPAKCEAILSDVGLMNTADGNRVLADSERIKTFFQTVDSPPITLLFWDAAWNH
jgi:hypothetical protein